jgi:hypothetical protein
MIPGGCPDGLPAVGVADPRISIKEISLSDSILSITGAGFESKQIWFVPDHRVPIVRLVTQKEHLQ